MLVVRNSSSVPRCVLVLYLSVFVYQQSKYSPNHGTGLCPVLLTGELIALVLELAVKEIRKVKHSRVAVVAWQLEKNSNIWYS